MGSIVIKLNPEKLANPDADLRYTIPDIIEELTNGRIKNNGYDYLDDEVTSMAIFLKSEAPKIDVDDVINILKNNTFKENNLYEIAEIYLSEKGDEDLDACNYDLDQYKIVKHLK